MTIGDRIKTFRKKAGFTQKQLAEKCGMAEITIRQYESGKREPKFEILRKIAYNLNVPIEYLIESISIGLMTENDVKAIEYFREQSLLDNYRQLNYSGQDKAMEQVELLTKIPEYQKEPPEE